jgi:dihydrodipicolinate synthase/N-acetylneuraminate lyase
MTNFDYLKSSLKGPVYSVITPFKDDNHSIDFRALEKYLEHIYISGGRVFYVMAYNSRFSELDFEEIKVLNTFVTRVVKSFGDDAKVIVADPIHCSTSVSIKFCQHAEAIGADMISLIFREKFYSQNQVATHYKMCAESTQISILIHEMPFISGHGGHTVNWPVELLDQLADVQNIVAIKEDAKDDTYSRDVISTISDRLSIIISGGGKRQWLQFADMGCQAWLNGIGVFEPALARIFYEAYQTGNQALIDKIISEIEVPFFENCVKKFGWHLAIKSALEARGLMSRNERMPMMALSGDEHKEVTQLISSLPINDIINRS